MKIAFKLYIIIAFLTCGSSAAQAASANEDNVKRNNYIPATISLEAQNTLDSVYAKKGYEMHVPAVEDKTAWRLMWDMVEKLKRQVNEQALQDNQVTVSDIKLGDVPALDIRPKDWHNNRKVIVYLHGGGYAMYSPRSTLVLSAPISRATGLRVIAVDYTTTPNADWHQIQEQAISAIKALLAEGYSMKDIALYGDSAGGGLAVATTINLRDSGIGMPAAVVLLSPWVDLTDSGDSMHTLTNTDPTLDYDGLMKNCALLYANNTALTDPHVSPLYADFSKGFAPTMIIEGTKSILLSSSVRLYQALDAAHQPVKIDMHEGMWHVFEQYKMPESDAAVNKAAEFINAHLLPDVGRASR